MMSSDESQYRWTKQRGQEKKLYLYYPVPGVERCGARYVVLPQSSM